MLEKKDFLLILLTWYMIRGFEILSGFVDFSIFRLLMMIILPLFIWSMILISNHKNYVLLFTKLNQSRIFTITVIIILTILGYLIFFTRYQRSANMGDTDLFRQSIQTTAEFQGMLFNEYEEGSHFKSHISPFLMLFSPIYWVLNEKSWYVIQFIHSFIIVFWCYWIGCQISNWSELDEFRWLLISGLFLATYTQHATFYDTRFAALGLALWISGMLTKKLPLWWSGFVFTLLTRETAVLTMTTILGCYSRLYPQMRQWMKVRSYQFFIATIWLIISLVIIRTSGGPISLGRFNDCLFLPSININYLACLSQSFVQDFLLKAGYTIRLLSFAPLILFQPLSILGSIPELGLTWLSKDFVLYNLSWHYYMPMLSIFLLFGFSKINRVFLRFKHKQILIAWLMATCLWQFITTFRFNFF